MKMLKILWIVCIIVSMMNACAWNSQVTHLELENIDWALVAYHENSPIDGTQPTIHFKDGLISGNTGCNHYGGNYRVKGESLTISALFHTEMACMEPEGVMEQEQAYLTLLSAVQRYQQVGDVLTIFTGSNETLVFEMNQDHLATPTPTHPSAGD